MMKRTTIFFILCACLLLMGCAQKEAETKGANSSEDYNEAEIIEEMRDIIEKQEQIEDRNEATDEQNDDDFGIHYYEEMDAQASAIYDAFIQNDWQFVVESLAEMKRPEEEIVNVYTTTSEQLYLVIEYLIEPDDWQAYLGEYSNDEKSGTGVMVSTGGTGIEASNVYAGEWKNNKPNGQGILAGKAKDIKRAYIGGFVDGKFSGEILIYGIGDQGFAVDWSNMSADSCLDKDWRYSTIYFDDGKPNIDNAEIISEYMEKGGWNDHNIEYFKVEFDGTSYYREIDHDFIYFLSFGYKEYFDVESGKTVPIYATFVNGSIYDRHGELATYGVIGYTTNSIDWY